VKYFSAKNDIVPMCVEESEAYSLLATKNTAASLHH
jgi:hypothetical protein